MTVNASIMKETFANWNCDHYSLEGCKALLTYYDEIDENMEFDPILICCDCTEYGNNCALSFSDMLSDYGYKYNFDECMEDAENDGEPVSLWNDEEKEDYYREKLIELLENYTTVLHVENGNYIVFNF